MSYLKWNMVAIEYSDVALLIQVKTAAKFLQNMCVSQSTRIRILSQQANKPSVLQSLGFMHQVSLHNHVIVSRPSVAVSSDQYTRT